MAYKRILTIQDISCVGQCSMTVALPILSACGHETCILPTAVLSTHTGGFGKPAVVHLDSALESMWRHWMEQGVTFDAIYTGYLGSIGAVEAAIQIADELLAPEGLLIVDPAMADHGKLYSGLTEDYAAAMAKLCRKADILLPNLTEAAMLTGTEYREIMDEHYVNHILELLPAPAVVLTGIGDTPGTTGAAIKQGCFCSRISHRRVERNFHGTGDIFAAAFVGALMRGKALNHAVQIAADYVLRCIDITMEAPAHWYGVRFESALGYLMELLNA